MSESCINIFPKDNPYLVGHTDAENILLNAWKNNKLHNSFIISGVEGIGKATLAYRFARFLLSQKNDINSDISTLEVNPNDKVFHLVSSGTNPDLMVLERGYIDTEKRKILKAIKSGEAMSDEEKQGLKKSSIIKVDDVRQINEFMSKKSANDGYRVVIVDCVDDLNTAGANAILKILEEPPKKSIIILISNNPNKLLPTILSRCAKLPLKPLDDNVLASLIRRYRPDVAENKISGIVSLSSGSIARAIRYIDYDALSVYDKICKIVYAKDKFSTNDLLNFATDINKDEEVYDLTKELILKFISENIKKSDNIEQLYECFEYALKVFIESEQLNLDKKQIIVNILVKLTKNI